MSHAMVISRIYISQYYLSQSYIEKLPKNDPFNRKKMEFSKNFKSFQFTIVQGSFNPNITILGEKL